MAEGMMLQPDHIRRQNESLRWFEANRGVLDRVLRNQASRRGQVLSDLSYTQIVTVENKTQEDWTAWSPVAVTKLPDGQTTDIANSGTLPAFPGYRFDDVINPGGGGASFPKLGVTQELIQQGKTGRVAIRGITLALMQYWTDGWGPGQRSFEYVRVHKDQNRWVLRQGLSGDAKFLAYLDYNPYEDGQNNDQFLVLIDLCHIHGRIGIWCGESYSTTMPRHSLVIVPEMWAKKPHADICFNPDVWATGGWDVPWGASGVAYKVTSDRPVLVDCGEFSGSFNAFFGPAPGSFQAWPGLPGLRTVGPGWTKSGATPNYYWCVKDTSNVFVKCKNASWYNGGSVVPVSDAGGGYVYDGSTYGGIVFPNLEPCGLAAGYWAPEESSGRQRRRVPNIQANEVVAARLDSKNNRYLASPECLDDPIGTVKMWSGSLGGIPAGWREYTAMQGKFPAGVKSDSAWVPSVGYSGGSLSDNNHPSGNGYATHLPPYSGIYFIERYQ